MNKISVLRKFVENKYKHTENNGVNIFRGQVMNVNVINIW